MYTKTTPTKNFAIVDAGMNDFMRPALYDAVHEIIPVIETTGSPEIRDYDIVGPVCETGDTFANKRALTPVADGEMVAFRSAGAYGAVMASEYNTRPLIPEVLVYGDQFSIIRDRPSIEAIIKRDIIINHDISRNTNFTISMM